MKEIKAIIRPSKLAALREALRDFPGFPGMTVSKVEGLSAPSRIGAPRHNLREELVDFTPKLRIEIVGPDDVANGLVDLIVRICSTGQIGDGLVWVTPVDRAIFVHKTVGSTPDSH
ncbi:P-II family nitrogen regulator [Propionivibrio dicarboxylicus]|uniref:Nitrogen regulatory protein P-II family n=1 Tax=Propionivibrio dicarboxylicus TaxID=83767 RepID=A0A1G8E2J3_9RHOO|nr:P-II family nitrogen regulator [Propionivibrio dicarboxylicus]SDH64065.1 nitrogen regulatory protein P-II family [Propionivibrio dicarboxylicus]